MSVKSVFVCFVVCSFGTVLCSLQGGVTSETSPLVCPLRSDVGEERWLGPLRDESAQCIFATSNTDIKSVMQNAAGTEQIREAVISYCNLRPEAVNCIEMTNWYGNMCLNNTDLQILVLAGGFYLKIHEISCKNDGQHFVNLVEAIKNMIAEQTAHPKNIVDLCTKESTQSLTEDDASLHDPSLYTIAQYSIVKDFKKCLNEHKDGNEAIVNALNPVLQELKDSLICLGPNGHITPCETRVTA